MIKPDKPLSLEDAQERECCRICHQPVEVETGQQPIGWKTRFVELLYPTNLVLNRGSEFAHKVCLPAEKPPQPPDPLKDPLRNWTFRGELGHTGDCSFWGSKLCDCGLLTQLRFAGSETQQRYPNYYDEMASHEHRIRLVRGQESLVQRFEQLVRQQAVHYQERPCANCGQTILDFVINDYPDTDKANSGWPVDKPMFIDDLFNQNRDPDDLARVKSYCRNCN